ncbi:MAG: hypothetical protein ACRC62_08660 [Microcoleus sp.]
MTDRLKEEPIIFEWIKCQSGAIETIDGFKRSIEESKLYLTILHQYE